MRDDLLDAQAAVAWAKAQRNALQERTLKWNQGHPYRVVAEDDPKTRERLLVVYPDRVDPMIVAEVGAIINMTHSALDLLMMALVERKRPGSIEARKTTYFPSFKLRRDFRLKTKEIKSKQWLIGSDLRKIEALSPYKRGNDGLIWRLKELDNLRKHNRFLQADFLAEDFRYFAVIPHQRRVLRRMKNKTVIFGYPPGTVLPIHPGNHNLPIGIAVTEPSLGIRRAPVIPLLDGFAKRVTEIIKMFNA